MLLISAAVIEVIGTLIFLYFIRKEAKVQGVDWNLLQVLVAIGWLFWSIWYGIVLFREKYDI